MAGLASLIQKAVAIADEVTTTLQATVQLYAWTGEDIVGNVTYADPVSLPALVEDRDELRQISTGQTVRARAKISFLRLVPPNGSPGRQEPIDVRDKIVLPDSTSGPIVDIRGLVDPTTSRPYLPEVWIGVGGGAQ